jgi:hypothetical protein
LIDKSRQHSIEFGTNIKVVHDQVVETGDERWGPLSARQCDEHPLRCSPLESKYRRRSSRHLGTRGAAERRRWWWRRRIGRCGGRGQRSRRWRRKLRLKMANYLISSRAWGWARADASVVPLQNGPEKVFAAAVRVDVDDGIGGAQGRLGIDSTQTADDQRSAGVAAGGRGVHWVCAGVGYQAAALRI